MAGLGPMAIRIRGGVSNAFRLTVMAGRDGWGRGGPAKSFSALRLILIRMGLGAAMTRKTYTFAISTRTSIVRRVGCSVTCENPACRNIAVSSSTVRGRPLPIASR